MYDNRMYGNLPSPGKSMLPGSQPEGFSPQQGYPPPPQQRNLNPPPGSANPQSQFNGPFQSPISGPPSNQPGGAPSPGAAMFPGSQPGGFPPQSGFPSPQLRNSIPPPSGSANHQSLLNGAAQSPISRPPLSAGTSMFPGLGSQSESFPPQSGYPPQQQKSLNPPPGSFNPQSQSNGGAAQSPISGPPPSSGASMFPGSQSESFRPPPSSEASMFPGSQSENYPPRSGYPPQQKTLNPPLGSENLLSQSNGSIQSPIGGPSPNQPGGPPPPRTSVSPGPGDSFPSQSGYPPSQQRNFNPQPGSVNPQQSNGGSQTPNSRPPSNPSPAVSSAGSTMFPGSQSDSFPPQSGFPSQSGFPPPPKSLNLLSGPNSQSPSNGPLQSPMSGPPSNQTPSGAPSPGSSVFPGSQSESFPPQSGFPSQQKSLNPMSGPGGISSPLGGPPSNQTGGVPTTSAASMFPTSQAGGFPPQSGFPAPQQKGFNPSPGSANPLSQMKGAGHLPSSGPPLNQPSGPPQRTSLSPGPQPDGGFPPQQKSFNAPPGPMTQQPQSNGGAVLSPMGGPPLNQPGGVSSFGASPFPSSQLDGGFPPQQKGFNAPPGPMNPLSQSNGAIQSPIGGPPKNQFGGGVPSLQRGMQQMGLGGPPQPQQQQQPPSAGPPPPGGPPRGPSNFLPQQSRLPQPGSALPPKQYPTSQVDGRPGPYTSPAPPGPNRMPQYGDQSYGQQPQQQQQHFASSPHPPHPSSGYPQPGGGYSSPGGYPQANYMSQGQQSPYPSQPAEQPRKLNPDQMPSPIQVIIDDQRAKSGKFYTNQKGLLPPLVTTDFIVQDQGNASARFIRSTMYNVPVTIDMMKQASVPFGIVLSPLAQIKDGENEPPLVDMGEAGPVRCVRCKAYMSPFMQFIDGGRRFHCLLCKATSEVPPNYFQHLDHTGQRVDRYERPELVLGAYEFVATREYCTNGAFPKPPAMIFLLDVSYNNIKSGMVHLLCSQMRSILQNLPKEPGQSKSSVRVGFITYNNTVHFYNIKACLGQPQMMVVGDVADMFMPLLDGFLCDPEESEQVIQSLMEQIPSMFADTRETETILAPAITAGLEALKAAECAGKLLVFHSSLPIAEAPGKLKNRDDRKLLGTDKEKTVLSPQNTVYNNLGQDCVGAGCSVDLFIFNNSYIDLPTIGQVSRLTGGQIYKYTYFQADTDGERLIMDICENISRPIAFNAIMRVRTSTGVRPTDFYGHFFMSNTTDMEFGSIDCNKAVAVEIKHDDKLTEEDGVYIQVALLYTSCTAQRRVRVLNLALNTCSQMADLFRACELDTIINFFSKQAVSKLSEATPKAVKEALINRCAQILACYRKHCALPSSAGQLILPECMKLLPLYINCVLKSDAVSGGSDLTIDDRWFAMDAVMISDIPSSVVYFYPRLIPLIDIDVTSLDIPVPLRCSIDKMNNDGAYILENGIYMFLWVGLNVSNDWIMNAFGVSSVMQIDTDKSSLPYLENPLNARIRELIKSLRIQRQRAMRLTLVRPRDKMEIVMKHFLVEDSGVDGSSSYVDFLCYMHKEIRNLLS